MTTNSEATAQLKEAILAVRTTGQMHALIVDYTYVEIMQVYQELTPQQQTAINAIYDQEEAGSNWLSYFETPIQDIDAAQVSDVELSKSLYLLQSR
ncbi:hypothetical protein [Lyngbya aestuarii]|uniref:hypothetical protein n=1 Tax=Lyngbya aestuarii TaxID=118322 RepID=UPI00403E22CA